MKVLKFLYYCTGDIFISTVNTLKYSMKNIPSVFNDEDYLLIFEFTTEFLNLIKSEIISFETLKDFEVISSVVGLVVAKSGYPTKPGNIKSVHALD